ncbi:protein kinase [Streptomyces sp. NPDC060334]|uniref:serine/threonine-protein kinase n=1 Tax=unclassified Streptomyces TaxID=2593676 RepID=UPI0006B04002|nr:MULTISPECIES: serine/threonine-protein kinase [unclassified Streptomyces]MCX5153592.1 serine/threonine protein kinase [Streptomyces sp. NBC_00291]
MNGTILAGRYALGDRIGAGGMGEVWRARDLELGRAVAVKVIARPGDDKLALRLRAEARAAAALSDPHVVSVHDVGETVVDHRTVVYLVMELVDGRPLGTATGRAPIEDVVRWGTQICEGLQAAHGAGVVHRDIKPGNVLLTTRGRIKICDFGIARQSGMQGLTTTGLAIGTPAYMSPEQARGDAVDGRTDIYSLGCLLYELLAGELPFTGSPWEVLAQHAQRAPDSLRVRRPEIPRALDLLVLSLLSKDAADRPDSAARTAELLRAAVAPPTRPVPEQGARTKAPSWQPRPPVTTRTAAEAPAVAAPSKAEPQPKAEPRSKGSPASGRAPGKSVVVSPGSAWAGTLLPGLAAGGQLFGFGALSGFWAVAAALGVTLVAWFSKEIQTDEADPLTLVYILLAPAVGLAVLLTLLFATPVTWWKAILVGLATAPVLWIVGHWQHKAIRAVSRAKEAAFLANDTGQIAGVFAAWLTAARTPVPALGAVAIGVGVWIGAGLLIGMLLPPLAAAPGRRQGAAPGR